ncbi:hypothetical protein [Streptomyces anulatus]|uniref:hypothetical protein n=1 Tax=Streptomyces anulatus TaxID=1892 RepID=UPI0036AB879D
MADPAAENLLAQMTQALLDTWTERVNRGIESDPAGHCAALATAALAYLPPPPPPADDRLPAYTGDSAVCPACSHTEVITRYRAAGEHGTQDPHTFRPSSKPARLERECWRCDYAWDEALAPPAGPAPYNIGPHDLGHAVQRAYDGWDTPGLSPACAYHMALNLLTALDIRWLHDAAPEDSRLEEAETTDEGTAP